uniref:AAA+ ATPase domain-containing protein n=1 Tax=Leersia perrieri TaxID=77586 RepID=A0A0D9WZI0_9ORYZ
MDHQHLALVVDGRIKKALATAASVAAYSVLAQRMARELLPDELRAAARSGAAFLRARLGGAAAKERHTLVIRRRAADGGFDETDALYDAARVYVATKIDPRAMRRLGIARALSKEPDGSFGWRTRLSMEPGDTTTDVFDGADTDKRSKPGSCHKSLELSFDAEHTATAIERYIPYVMSTVDNMYRQEHVLRIYMNEYRSWHGVKHHHPSTFDTLAMDPALKRDIIADLDRFMKRKDYYRRIGKAWKRGYLLYGPPGTGKSSLVAAMANYLRFNLYDLDLSEVHCNTSLQKLLMAMPNKSVLVIEDIDCCFTTKSREAGKTAAVPEPAAGDGDSDSDSDDSDEEPERRAWEMQNQQSLTLSGLLNFIDGLWSTSGEQRLFVFTTNYKERLDAALLRPGRMDMHIYMGYCGWDAFKTLVYNYFLVDDHPLFPEIKELLADVEATPAEVSELLLRSEDADLALQGITKLLADRRREASNKAEIIKSDAEIKSDPLPVPSLEM